MDMDVTRLDTEAMDALEVFSADGVKRPLWVSPSGVIYALAGVWSTGQRAYRYQHIEVAGVAARESSLAQEIGCWHGAAASEVYSGCDYEFDGVGYHLSGKRSVVALCRILAGPPVSAKIGSTYRSSSGKMDGSKKTLYYRCEPATYHGYLRACKAFSAQVMQAAQAVLEARGAEQER